MLFFVLLLANLGLLNGTYMKAENIAEYVLQSSQLKHGTGEVSKGPSSIPQKLVFKWTGHANGYKDRYTLVPSYVASVSYGPNTSSLIYTCIWTSLLPAHMQSQTGFVQGPDGYSCKITQGKPGPLTEPLNTTQRPGLMSSTAAPATQPDSLTDSAGSVSVSNEASVPNSLGQQPNTAKTRTLDHSY